MTYEEFFSVWMLGKMKKRKKIDNFELQTLRHIVKEGGPEVIEKFEEKFKEMRIEGKRKVLSSSTMSTENLPRTHYTETEIEAMYMGTESEARKRYQRSGSFSQRRQVPNGRQISLS